MSLIVLVRSAGSTFIAEVTRARPSSGVMATDMGGPTTLAGTGISATARGGLALRSITVMVSGAGFWTTWTAPFTSATLLSLAEMAIWARRGGRHGQGEERGQEQAQCAHNASLGAGLEGYGVPYGRADAKPDHGRTLH